MKSDNLYPGLFKEYDNFIFDFDGVVLNSNAVKEVNIEIALKRFLPKDTFNKSLNYFNENPGVSRELKLSKFINSKQLQFQILKLYNKLNLETLISADLVEGVVEFLSYVRSLKKNIFILSGGKEDEVMYVLDFKNMLHNFDAVKGGPMSKIENLSVMELVGNSIFFGDSKYDMEVARLFNFDFVFVYGYSKYDLRNEFKSEIFMSIRNFNEFKKLLK